MNFSPLTLRRIENFKNNKKRSVFYIHFLSMFFVSIFANFIANDKPLFVVFDKKILFPVIESIPETFLGENLKLKQTIKIHLLLN